VKKIQSILNAKQIFYRAVLSLTAILFSLTSLQAQNDEAKNAYEDLSLKELLNVKIVSVSKNAEFLFEAPLSASVITKEDIRRAGSTSIMEALRLVPGVIVREQTNGNYDIHLRGMDNIPPNSSFDIASTTTLVMIDNRPIYSYLRGGTFWETLPVDLNDVEKIEVVRGPAAALYGPNAVNGVINIITRKLNKQGVYAVANAQQGTNHTFINNASIGYKSDKWNGIISGNYQGRQRSQTSYFNFYKNDWYELGETFIKFQGDTVRNMFQRYPDQHLALDKYGTNLFLNYEPTKKTRIGLTAGLQDSKAQRVAAENEVTPLSTTSSKSKYVDLHAAIGGLTAQFSYNSGTQVVDSDPGNKFDFTTFDANVEYNYVKGKFSIKPGLSYKTAVYDDTEYSDTLHKAGIFNSRGEITTASGSLRTEYTMIGDRLRLVAGVAANKFNYPDDIYISYQMAATFKADKNNLFRFVYSLAPRSSNVFDTYVDQTIAYYPSGYKKYTWMMLAGNKDLKLLTAHLMEAGYRGRLGAKLNIDIEAFNIRAKNYNLLVTSAAYTKLNGTDTVSMEPIVSTNLPLTSIQHGVTVSLIYTSGRMQFKPFVTVQGTRLEDYAPYNNTPDAPYAVPGKNIYGGMGTTTKLKSTPAVYGGASLNYSAFTKWNVNLNAYYYSEQDYYHLTNVIFADGERGVDHIDSKLLLNARISFEPKKGLQLFGSAKNLLDDTSREFYKSDIVPLRFFVGINYEL
jgi:iron complex outermembrane receptor protein